MAASKAPCALTTAPATSTATSSGHLWASQPQRKLDFRYGYVDSKRSYHLLVTRRAPVATP